MSSIRLSPLRSSDSNFLLLLSPIFILLLSFNVQAQDSEIQYSSPDHYLFFTVGHSQKSVRLLGKTRDSRAQVTKIGYATLLKSIDQTSIYFTYGIIPFIRYDYSRRDHSDTHTIAKGFGISPWGFEVFKPLNSNFDFRVSTSGSIFLMNKVFPTDKARKLNFAFDISPSLNYRINPSFSFSFGYKYHHISNAQTGKQNPGLDSNFIFISLISQTKN